MANSEYINLTEAREILGVSRMTMTHMVQRGNVASEPNPVDRRSRIVKRAEIEAMAAKAPGKKDAA